MGYIRGGSGDDLFMLSGPGNHEIDGGPGIDSLDLAALRRSQVNLAVGNDTVTIDTVAGAPYELHVVLRNLELLSFDNGQDVVDLRTYFGAAAGPTVVITDDTPGTATGPVTFHLLFSEAITGLTPQAFGYQDSSVVRISGSGAVYTVVFSPTAAFDGDLPLHLQAGSVTNLAGVRNAFGAVAEQTYDLNAPQIILASPVEQWRGTDVGSDFWFTFDEPVRIGTGSALLLDEQGAVVARYGLGDSPVVSLSGQTLVINPSSDVPSGKHFSWQLPKGAITDLAGNAFLPAQNFSFSTNTRGNDANEVFSMGPGNLYLDGRGGIDTLALPLARGAYTLDLQLSESLVLAKDGSGQLRMDSMERLSFADSKLALDNSFNGHGGITAMTLGVVFGARAVREHPDYVGIGLGLLDQGMTPLALMQLALDARLGAKASPQAVVDLLYFNVLGAHPSDAESAPYVALLNDGSFTPASLALMASSTSYNIDNIHLMGPGGLQETGLTYWG